MRKFFGAPGSDQEHDAERAALEHISLEQEQLMCDAAAQAQAEVNQDLEETARVGDISDALEDLAIIASKIDKPTAAELALVDNAASMAVAGTDVASEELIPAFEEISDLKERMQAAAASAKEKAKRIWEKIMAFLKRIWEQVEEFFYNLLGTIPAQRRRIAELREEIKNVKDKRPTAETVTLKAGSTALVMNNKLPAEASDLALGLAALHEAASWLYGPYIEQVIKHGQVVAKHVAAFDWAYPATAVAAMADELTADFGNIPGSFRDSRHRHPGYNTYQGRSLPGNKALVERDPIFEDGNVLHNLQMLQKSGVALQSTGTFHARELTLPVFSMEMASALLDDVDGLLGVLEGWNRGAAKSRMKQVRKDIADASAKASQGADKAAGQEDEVYKLRDEQIACYRAVLDFNASYTSWAAKPTMALLSSAMATCRAVVAVVRESNRLYKEDAVAIKETPKPGKDKIKKTAS